MFVGLNDCNRPFLIRLKFKKSMCCRYLVTEAKALGLEVIDRCNLTVLQEPGQEDLVDFLAQHRVCF